MVLLRKFAGDFQSIMAISRQNFKAARIVDKKLSRTNKKKKMFYIICKYI